MNEASVTRRDPTSGAPTFVHLSKLRAEPPEFELSGVPTFGVRVKVRVRVSESELRSKTTGSS